MKQKIRNSRLVRYLISLFSSVGASLYTLCAQADISQGPSGPSISTITTNVSSSLSGLMGLIYGGSYIAGLGFALTAILKFKQHKDNPTQIPIGTPIALLFIAAALLFLPTFVGIANETLFSGSGSTGAFSGAS